MALDICFDSYYGKCYIAVINDFERTLGVVLPKEYKDIVAEYNGAFIVNKGAFRYFNRLTGEEEVRSAGMFLPFGQIKNVTETMEIKLQYPPEDFPQGLVIFSAMGNGDALCFDYHKGPDCNPPIVVWHHEAMSTRDNEISFVAESFADFLEMLFESEEE